MKVCLLMSLTIMAYCTTSYAAYNAAAHIQQNVQQYGNGYPQQGAAPNGYPQGAGNAAYSQQYNGGFHPQNVGVVHQQVGGYQQPASVVPNNGQEEGDNNVTNAFSATQGTNHFYKSSNNPFLTESQIASEVIELNNNFCMAIGIPTFAHLEQNRAQLLHGALGAFWKVAGKLASDEATVLAKLLAHAGAQAQGPYVVFSNGIGFTNKVKIFARMARPLIEAFLESVSSDASVLAANFKSRFQEFSYKHPKIASELKTAYGDISNVIDPNRQGNITY